MTGQGLPKRCRDAYEEIAFGRLQAPELKQVQIAKEHTLYRCLTRDDIDPDDQAMPVPGAFQPHDLSVYAVGPELPQLCLQEVLASNQAFVAVAEIPADLFEDKERFPLQVVHDPYRDPVGNQHPNHVRIICTKGATICKAIMRAARVLV